MQTIKAIERQGVLDMMIQIYGTVNALSAFIADNIHSDYKLDDALELGSTWNYDIENGLAQKKVLRGLNNKQIKTFKIQNTDNSGLLTESGFVIFTEDGQKIIP